MSADIARLMDGIGSGARAAAAILAETSTEAKNAALRAAAKALIEDRDAILAANARDLAAARAQGLTKAMLDRLMLDEGRLRVIAKGLDDVAALPDPVGAVIADWTRPNGLRIQRVRVPIGVIGVIFE